MNLKERLLKEESIGIWAHLDVVPEGEGWMSDPYKPVIRDGLLFGRGVSDNKSSAIGGLYILKAIRDLNMPLNHNIQLYCGTSEETGMDDVSYYAEHYEFPKFSFVPDVGFPGACGEFGRTRYKLVSRKTLSPSIVELDAGSAFNIIPNYAYVLLKNENLALNSIPSDGYKVTHIDDLVKIEAYGTSKHAAGPEGAINAIHQLTKVLSTLDGLCEEDKAIFAFLTKVNDEPYGTFLNINMNDEASGQTVSSGTILRFENGIVSLCNDCRFCVSDTAERIVNNIKEVSNLYDFEVEVEEMSKPYYLDKNSLPIQAINKAFKEATNSDREMYVSKGGTYAGQLERAVATGMVYRSNVPIPTYIAPGHGAPHQPDECLPIDGYMEGIKLFARLLFEVDKVL